MIMRRIPRLNYCAAFIAASLLCFTACDESTPKDRDVIDLIDAPDLTCGGEVCPGLCCDEVCVLGDDRDHCGACGRACGPYEVCQGGQCLCQPDGGASLFLCGADEICCPGQGCLVSLSDPWNCGACGQQCQAGEVCQQGRCLCGDLTSADGPACTDGNICCGDACATADAEICACADEVCGLGQRCCDEACVDLAVDYENCGDCGQRCALGQRCLGGQCTCRLTTASCDGDASTGCEVDLRTNVSHCGRCGQACESGFVCYDGRCVQSCPVYLDNCQGSCVDTELSRFHCGACGNTCPPGEVCSSGSCGLNCQLGLEKCGDICVDLQRDLSHCGACGRSCSAGEVCWDGRCQVACPSYLTRCGQRCVDARIDPAHCGGCGLACDSGLLCAQGQCLQVCPDGLHPCAGGCVDLASHAGHCGACGVRCLGGMACVNGECLGQCPWPQIMCEGECVDPRSDVVFCGATTCTNATPCGLNQRCQNGQCVCAPGFADCNQDPADGCEAHTPTEEEHCGACGVACGTAQTCCSGSCVDRSVDVDNCGACAVRCGGGANAEAACFEGFCALDCDAGWDDCNLDAADGCEFPVAADVNNCGACGLVCSQNNGTALCAESRCSITCDDGYGNCNDDASDGCESELGTDIAHCGGCGIACHFANAEALCVDGACAMGACAPFFFDCDNDPSNGCESVGQCTITDGPCVECQGGWALGYSDIYREDPWDCDPRCHFIPSYSTWFDQTYYTRLPMGCEWTGTSSTYQGMPVDFKVDYDHVNDQWEITATLAAEPGCTWRANVDADPMCEFNGESGQFTNDVLLVGDGFYSQGCDVRLSPYGIEN